MIRTLIIENDLNYSKNILNYIINKFENLQLIYIATTYQESIEIISNSHIDLILLSLDLSNSYKIIEKIKYLNIIKKLRIVALSQDIESINKIGNNNQICETIYKLESFEIICRKMEKVIYDMDYDNSIKIKNFISSELLNMGDSIKYKGTQYILESIIYIYENNNLDLLDNLEQNVYKYISSKHNKSINNIKTNIIKATNEREKEKLSLYRLTPKLSIMTILNKISCQNSY